MIVKTDRLYRTIGYTFTTSKLAKQALTHCSAGVDNYERFEFLGDSILSFVIASELFQRFPERSEGELSRLRAHLVKGDTLAEIAKEISLGDYLFLGQGELKSGGFRRASILADALEALFAAVYLDGGLEAARQVILSLYQTRLDDGNLDLSLKDPKTQLQEYLQSTKRPLPEYQLTHMEGDEHEQVFHVTCTVKGIHKITKGQAQTRRKAEQIAAKALLDYIQSTVKSK